jgi:lysophospholipase L1-like esterase
LLPSVLAQEARWLAAAALAALALAACGNKVAQLPQLAASDVIVAFGDSLTFGTGASEQESYPLVLGSLLGRQVVRAGVPGEVTAQGLARLPQVIEEHRPKLVIVCLGGNDMLRKVKEAEIRSNLKAIVKTLKEQGIGVVLVGVPKPALITGPAEFYAEIAKEFGIPYEERVVTSVLYAPDMKSDPIHPNAKGYRRMAEALAELLRKAGAI